MNVTAGPSDGRHLALFIPKTSEEFKDAPRWCEALIGER